MIEGRHTEIDWRKSQSHQQLLLNFAGSPSSVDELRPKDTDWEGRLGESLVFGNSQIKKRAAHYFQLMNPNGIFLHKRSAEELMRIGAVITVSACFGTSEQMAERLVSVDPSGLTLGYPGELLKCSPEVRRHLSGASPSQSGCPTLLPLKRMRMPVVVGPNPLDLRKAECPYCHKTLPKVPGRKKKCLHCGGFMFVRTRPEDRARVVVTQAEADRIDCDWSIIAYAAEPDLSYLSSRQEVEGKPEGPGASFSRHRSRRVVGRRR